MSIKIGNNNKIDNSNISDSFYRKEDKWDYIGYVAVLIGLGLLIAGAMI